MNSEVGDLYNSTVNLGAIKFVVGSTVLWLEPGMKVAIAMYPMVRPHKWTRV